MFRANAIGLQIMFNHNYSFLALPYGYLRLEAALVYSMDASGPFNWKRLFTASSSAWALAA